MTELSEAARQLIEHESATSGVDPARAIANLLNRSPAERRRLLLKILAEKAPSVPGDSTEMIREDRDG